MGRVSRAQAQHNRQRVIETAARLFRERGVQAVGVAELMAAAGLTHGGFYKQFTSKEALVTEATAQVFDEFIGPLPDRDPDRPEDHLAERTELLDRYFATEHRDDPGAGCPASWLAADVGREAPDSPVRAVYAKGAEDFSRWLATDSDEDLATLSTMVGALLLARATRGTDLSARILAAARASVDA